MHNATLMLAAGGLARLNMMRRLRASASFVAAIVLFLGLPSSASANNIAYMTTSNQFGIIDLDTGVFTQLGVYGARPIAGLGEVGGALYGGDASSGPTLFRVNPTNGSVTAVGNGSLSYNDLGSTTFGLFATDLAMNLFSIDPATGASTLLGPTGLSPAGHGLSAGSSTMYLALDSGGTSALYSMNTATGAATLIGITGITIEAMVFENGILYATSPNSIYTLNPATGAATFAANISGAKGGVSGLAPGTPEPSSFILLGTGLVGLMAILRRSRPI